MKYAPALLVAVAALLFTAGMATRTIGLTYPRVVQNQPLHHPIKVIKIEGLNLSLEDGKTLLLEFPDQNAIDKILSQSEYQIDIDVEPDGTAVIFARQNGWICGTPWAQPIRIPIFPETVYRNRRERIGWGAYVQP